MGLISQGTKNSTRHFVLTCGNFEIFKCIFLIFDTLYSAGRCVCPEGTPATLIFGPKQLFLTLLGLAIINP